MTTAYLDELKKRRDFFQTNFPPVKVGLEPFDKKADEVLKNTCPVCGFMTLDSRIAWDICVICFWEDDGVDDDSLNELSGPNHMNLIEGRIEFEHTWKKLNSSTPPDNDSISFLRKKFFELNNLIDTNRVDCKQSIIGLQKEILDFLESNKIYGLAKLFK
jgi:hypothetical protein